MSKKSVRSPERANKLSNKLIIIPAALLIGLSTLAVGTKYEKEIRQILSQPTVNQTGTNIKVLPKDGEVERVVDGDTIVLKDGTTVRYVGINVPDKGEPYFEYDAYTKELQKI